ncbi:TetR/AcrR family transcriptional regulator [Nocardia brasiliensis]|uniref:TetR/AcrR family transcriptional regulator n=1 Tax=Nocardia brasiliensis TaxID=37326 RepID=UPI0024553026|nr:TetR family transcriptional regulator [Nocardia brasiliensis]
MASDANRPRRRRDPAQRRAEIIAAAETIIAEHGVGALTHRAVAQQAGLSPGSATYYFETLDEILIAALQNSLNHLDGLMTVWADTFRGADHATLLAGLVDSVMICFGPDRNQMIVSYELTTAAMRNPALRPLAQQSIDISVASLSQIVDPDTAVALTTTIAGQVLLGLATETPPTRSEVEATLARVLGPAPKP